MEPGSTPVRHAFVMQNMFLGTAVLVVCLFGGCSGTSPQNPDELVSLTDDGAWCWFQDPRAVYIDGDQRQTFAAWMTKDGDLEVGSYDHDTGAKKKMTLKHDWDADDHNTASLLALPDRRIMACYAQHNKTGLFCRISTSPESITDWQEGSVVSDTDRITYSHPVYLAAENRFYVFWRGPSWKPTFSWSDNGTDWSDPQILIMDEGRDGQGIRPYLKVFSNGKSAIHFTFTDGHPRNEAQNSVYYLRYENGAFSRADGEIVGRMESLPVSHSRSDLVYDASVTDVRAWVWDVAADEDDNPVIAYTRLPEENDHRYFYARWTGTEWLDHEIVPAGAWFPQTPVGETEPEPHYSAGISIDHSFPSRVYLSRPIDGVFEIERYSTDDGGLTWARKSITNGSSQPNVRPVVPFGYRGGQDHVIWMSGPYEHYTRYNTGLQMRVY